jgi:predicted membrane protein
MENQHHTNHGRILLGIILIGIGVLYAFDFFSVLPNIHDWIFSWGSLFVLIGIVNLASKRKPLIALIFIAGGIYFYVQEFLFGIPLGWHHVWPIGLVIIGLGMILRGSGGRGFHKGRSKDGKSNIEGGSEIDDMSVFGGGDKIVNSDSFTGGKVTAIFGGSDIDLTQAKIKNGPAVLDLFVMFGGTTIFAPKEWSINIQLTPIFGGFSDKRFNISPSSNDPDKELIIKGLVLFGGGEVKGR